MKFVKERENTERYVDNIFSVVRAAKADPEGINATAGCLYNEEGELFTYASVYDQEKQITPIQRASYAASPAGNDAYVEAITRFVLEDKVDNHHRSIATPGGTGAIYTSMRKCLEEGDTILYPAISWGNYKVMASEMNLKTMTYDIYDLDDLFRKLDMFKSKVFLIVNSPCENPLGYSYSTEEWKRIMEKLVSLKKEVVLLCDIAYIDYARDGSKEFFTLFNDIPDDLLVLIAASASKAFSYYGQRIGALIAIHNDPEFLDHFINLSGRLARATWSNLSNAAMLNISEVLDHHYEEYQEELAQAKGMLKKRTDLFIRQAEECGLELYRFSDGFFVTIRMENNEVRDSFHQKLIDHHIYTIKVNRGIRVALCSMPLRTVDGLAKKIKELM
ncbi:MAG: aminotransferase class I/II-fold pyridoxal phosphate-dependent enzyme [Erysipelotrichaceae bacterium]|nr:aminotransferase class I/II-fold pyridoxal phosphate-dependent enzyme [Erysipelotrichaceae bacterium]